VVGEASSGGELLERIGWSDAGVLLLDISMPGPGVLELLQELRQRRPGLHVLVLSMHPEEQYAVRVLRAGADGYLTKEQTGEHLLNAIRRVAQGGKYVTASLAERLALGLTTPELGRSHETLSDREYAVFRYIASGLSLKQIAATLELSPKTVSTYRTRVLEKMGLKTNADLIRYALEHGLTE
jgi:DNA-binding NarL/FixJ family response regulator